MTTFTLFSCFVLFCFFKGELLHSSFLKHNSNQNCSRSFKLNCISTVGLFTTNVIGGKQEGYNILLRFLLLLNQMLVFTQHSLLYLTYQLLSQNNLLRYVIYPLASSQSINPGISVCTLKQLSIFLNHIFISVS